MLISRHTTLALGRWLSAVAPVSRPASTVTYSVRLVAVVAACVATAIASIVLTWQPPIDWLTLVALTAVITVISRFSTRAVSGVQHVWAATVLLHLGMTLVFGAAGAVAASLGEAAGATLRIRNGWFRASFNWANMVCSDVAALEVYRSITSASAFESSAALGVTLGGIAAGVVHWTVNHALLVLVFLSIRGRAASPVRFMRDVSGLLPYSMLYGFAAVAFPLLFRAYGMAGAMMCVAPLGAAQAFLLTLERSQAERAEARRDHIEEITRSAQRVEVAQKSTLIALTKALDARDQDTVGHSRRVVEYSREIGKVLNLDEAEMRVLVHGALLHDIGKIGIPDAILLKPSRLNEEEWALMRQHPEIGARMVEDVDVLRGARRIILHHHERFDGSGYPRGLVGTAIVRGARIFAVADAIDAMTQDRPYRKAMGWEQAFAELARHRGQQFDPEALDALGEIGEERLLTIAAVRRPPQIDLLEGIPVSGDA